MSKRQITTLSGLSIDYLHTGASTPQGFYVDQLTQTQINNISTDFLRNGGIVYNNNTNFLKTYNGSWNTILTGSTGGAVNTTGNVTLAAGTSGLIPTTAVTANSIILLTRKTAGGTIGNLTYIITTPGTNFTINSDNILDTSVVSWLIINV